MNLSLSEDIGQQLAGILTARGVSFESSVPTAAEREREHRKLYGPPLYSKKPEDYDLSPIKAEFGELIADIVIRPKGNRISPSGKTYANVDILLTNGDKRSRRILYIGEGADVVTEDNQPAPMVQVNHKLKKLLEGPGQKEAAALPQQQAQPKPTEARIAEMCRQQAALKPTATATNGDLELCVAAAVNTNRIHSRGTTAEEFYNCMISEGRPAMVAMVAPLLKAHPFPEGLDAGGKMMHVRNLVAEHLAPKETTYIPQVSLNLAEFENGWAFNFRGQWDADTCLRLKHVNGGFTSYESFMKYHGDLQITVKPVLFNAAYSEWRKWQLKNQWDGDAQTRSAFPDFGVFVNHVLNQPDEIKRRKLAEEKNRERLSYLNRARK